MDGGKAKAQFLESPTTKTDGGARPATFPSSTLHEHNFSPDTGIDVTVTTAEPVSKTTTAAETATERLWEAVVKTATVTEAATEAATATAAAVALADPQPPVLEGGGGNLGRGPNLGYPQN